MNNHATNIYPFCRWKNQSSKRCLNICLSDSNLFFCYYTSAPYLCQSFPNMNATLLSRRYTFSVLREKCSQLRILYPAKLPFKKNKAEQNIDLLNRSPRDFYHQKIYTLKGILKQPFSVGFHKIIKP